MSREGSRRGDGWQGQIAHEGLPALGRSRRHGACAGASGELRCSIRVAMRTFIFGVAAGAIVAAAVIRFAPPRYRPFGSDSPPPASVTATTAAICGRDTFNVNVNVHRLFPGSGGGDPLGATLEKHQDAFADGLHDRLNRAGLRHELACPVMLDIFGMATENQQGVWLVSAHVRLNVASDTKMVYPSWDSGNYRAVFVHVTEAQADLERALTERVRRFLEFFGKPDDGHVASPVPGTGRQ